MRKEEAFLSTWFVCRAEVSCAKLKEMPSLKDNYAGLMLALDKNGKDIEKLRWAFENVTFPLIFYSNVEEVISKSEEDNLIPLKLFDEIAGKLKVDDPYFFTKDMAEAGDMGLVKYVFVKMPEPERSGQAYSLILFSDKRYERPAYYAVRKNIGGPALYHYNVRLSPEKVCDLVNADDCLQTAYRQYRFGYCLASSSA